MNATRRTFTVHHVTAAPTTRRVQDSYAVAPKGVDANVIENTDLSIIATAHQTGAMWSVLIGTKPIGLAPTREIAIAHLERIASVASAKVS